MASPEDSRPRVPSKLECSLMAEKRKSCVTRCSQPGGTARSGQPKPTGIRSAGSHVADLTLVTGPGTGDARDSYGTKASTHATWWQ